MGSWNETCALSNLPIKAGDDVVFLILTRNPYKENEAKVGCYIGDFWFPRTVPIFAKYNDYGNIEGWEPCEQVLIDGIVEGYKKDLITGKPTSRDITLSIPARSKENINWPNLLEWLQEGHVYVDGNLESRASTMESRMRSKRSYDKVVRSHGKLSERMPKKADEKTRAGIQLRNNIRKHEKTWRSKKTRDFIAKEKGSRVLPCVKIMIRKDVWDSLLEMSVEGWELKETIATYRQQAVDFIAGLREVRKITESIRRSINDLDFIMANKKTGPHYNVFTSRLGMSSSSYSGPPFQMVPGDLVKEIIGKCLHDDKDGHMALALERLGQLYFIESVMASTRRAWLPTIGAGSQAEGNVVHAEFHLRCAAIAKKCELQDTQEEFEEYTGAETLDEYEAEELESMRKNRDKYRVLGALYDATT